MSLYSFYLLGFIFYPPWRRQCIRCACYDDTGTYAPLTFEDDDEEDENNSSGSEHSQTCPKNLNSNCQHEECENRHQSILKNMQENQNKNLENSNSEEAVTPALQIVKQCYYKGNYPYSPSFCFSEPELYKAFSSDGDSIVSASTVQSSERNLSAEDENVTDSRLGNLIDVDLHSQSGDDEDNQDLHENANSEGKDLTPMSTSSKSKSKKKRKKKGVKFNKLKEVVKLFDNNDAWMARMSYSKFERMKGRIKELDSRNKILELVKVASIFTLPLFMYKICDRESLKYSPSVALRAGLGFELLQPKNWGKRRAKGG